MSNTFISGNVIKFQNPFTKQDITLQHTDSGYDLIFNSNVVFSSGSNHSTIKVGKYIVQTDTTGEELQVFKDSDLLLTLNKS